MLLLLVIALCTSSVKTLTCHCFNNTKCSANGYCSSGCDYDWSGPGCQVGNVAFNKSAYQSTTYSVPSYTGNASLAVDGIVPVPSKLSNFCSHTDDTNQMSAWWYVTLSTTHDFVITSVTLVNRIDPDAPSLTDRLRDFVILYSMENRNETAGEPHPNNTTWKECARQSGSIGYNRTYACTATTKQIAVYMLNSSNPVLTLCEVKVFGYQLDDCPNGFTGPGCLLRKCNDQCNATGGSCDGEYGSCRYSVCPDRSLLPPDCWITLSNYSAVQIQSNTTCNTVLFSVEMEYSQPNIAASMLLLQVSNSPNGTKLVNVTIPVFNASLYSYNNASPGATYDVSVTPIYCNFTNFPCFYSTGSKVFTTVIGKRDYQLSNNQTCIFVTVNSSTVGCELPTAVKINCTNNYTKNATAHSSSFFSCGLKEDLDYECSITATIYSTTNWFDRLSFNPTFLNILETTAETLPPSENKTGTVAGSIVGVVVVIFIVSIIAVVYSRRQRRAKTMKLQLRKESTVVLNVTNVPPHCSDNPIAEGDDQTYYNISGMTLSQFQLYVQDDALITRRFSELQANEVHPCTKGKAPENKGKNRFQNILPYDSNRVLLDGAGSDYINASYIDGFFKHKEFIATQGPSPKTVEDFWKMLWQENCSVIIMLTDYVEHAKKKCEKYFPFPKSSTIDMEVTLRSTCIYDTHSVSVLDVRHGSELRLVHHFHFLAWPDQSVPSHSAEVLLFYNRICRHLKLHPSKGPVVVHCSAGVGRTGAYLAFDYLQQRYQSEHIIDVDSCVVKLRDQRMFMVQTKDQYLFLHRAVLYGIQTTRYIYEAAQLTAMAQAENTSDVGIDMAAEWRELEALVPTLHVMKYATAALPENECKNRRNNILALDSKRPMISLPDGSNQLYINAVYCNGCFSNRAFIATQLPLKHTIADFWLMVYDCQPSCIVLLHNLLTDDEECPRFWPEPGHSVTTEWLVVKCDLGWKEESTSNTVMPGFGITLSPVSGRMTACQTVSTKLFTTSLWDTKSSAELPENSNHLLTTAMALRAYSVDAPHQPIIVQCSDGVTQCGLFLSAMNALHRLIETGQVSVFHTVDLLRSSRPEFVTSEAQYRFIYKLLEIYRDSSNIYANT